MGMFRRKATTEVQGEKCPFCEFVNPEGTMTCVQCYYEINKAPRDQGDVVSEEVSNSLFDELMADEDDAFEEADAVDVVLTLDADPLEINQYEVTDFETEEPEKVGFIESSSPELNETVSHEPEDVTADEVGEPIKDYEKIDFSGIDPLAEVPEPVHKGKGTVFSPNTPEMDGDLKGHIGGSELPSLPSDDLYENKIDLTATKAPAPTPETVALPEIPDVFDFEQPAPENVSNQPSQVVAQETKPEESQTVTEELENNTDLIENQSVEEIPEVVTEEAEPSNDTTEIPPTIQSSRFWPWPEQDPWDARIVHREVVSALEFTKAGKNDEAQRVIDELGPHLTDENVDLIYHIGMVLKQIGRSEQAKSMLELANQQMPGNEHIESAVAHLAL